ncbi:MAG: hypothetical protein JXR10_00155 [Cyclobacteriaceae bacterium]
MKKFTSKVLLTALVALLSVGVVSAADVTWTGAGDGGSWDDASNWDAGIPTAADVAVFSSNATITDGNATAVPVSITAGTLTIGSGVTVNTIGVASSTSVGPVTIASGAELVVDGTLNAEAVHATAYNSGQMAFKVTGGTITVSSTGTIAVSGPNRRGFDTNAGSLTVAAGGTVTIGSGSLQQAMLIKGGFSVTNNGTINLTQAALEADRGEMIALPNSAVFNNNAGATLNLTNNSTVASKTIAGKGTTGSFMNAGTVTVSGSADNLDSYEGTFTNAAGATYTTNGDIELVAGAVVTNNGSIEIGGDLTGGGTMTVGSGGSLVTMGAVTGGHTFTRNTTSADGKYSAVGSPISSGMTSSLGSLVYKYDESIAYVGGSERFTDISNSAEAMAPGDGYFTAFTGGSISFTGTPNTGAINASIANAGYNLVSNPYPCAVNYSTFIAAQIGVIGSSIYIWDDGGSDAGQRTNSDYITVNDMGTAGAGSGRASDWNGHIGSAQAFMVNTSSTDDIVFTDAMKVSGMNADANFFRTAEYQKIKLSLTSAASDFSYTTLIGLAENATLGIDKQFDAFKIGSNTELNLYSLIDGEKFAIQGLPFVVGNEELTIPLGVEFAEAGEYTLNVNELTNWRSDLIVKLQDNLLNTLVELTPENGYTFTSDGIADQGRFTLRLSTASVLSASNSQIGSDLQILPNGIQLMAAKNAGSVEINILDISGRVLFSNVVSDINTNQLVPFNFSKNEIYLVKVGTSEGVSINKIIFK